MTRDDVMRLAREAGFVTGYMNDVDGVPSCQFVVPHGKGCIVELEKFYALVSASEREACAQVVTAECIGFADDDKQLNRIISAIRARNEVEQEQ